MVKIAFIGAGSVVFTKNLLGDILSFPEFRDVTIALHDIDPERLETAGLMAHWTSKHLDARARVAVYPNRAEALAGADFVINMVQIGGHEATLKDFDIPRKYGLKQTVADSMGIGGLFRALRTIPFMLELAADIERLCPRAVLLNYTNPMSALTWAVYKSSPIQVVGLCHSVQHTVHQIASYVGVPEHEVVYECAGINHIAFFSRLEWRGEDLHPRLLKAADDPAVYAQDKVRFELMKRFGRFVTEGSTHNAEYTPYFLKRDELIERFDVHVDAYVVGSAENLRSFAETRRRLLAGEDFEVVPSVEYGSGIIHALVSGQPRLVYGNVENRGLVPNLPGGCCVEVPVVVDAAGLRPTVAPPIELQLTGHMLPHVVVQDLTVRAALEGRRDYVYQAAMLDRHASSVLSLDETAAMVDELIDAHGEALPAGVRRP